MCVCVCVSLCVTVCAQLSKRVALLQEDLNSPVKNKKRKVVKALSVHCHTALCVCVCVCVCVPSRMVFPLVFQRYTRKSWQQRSLKTRGYT